MSTYPQYPLKSQDVYTLTIHTLDTLPLTMPGAIQSRDLWRVLVFAAASHLSVHQACHQLERAPSAPTVLGPLAQQLAALDALEGHANALLARLIPKGLGKRGRRIAIDLIALPYHGTVDAAHQDEVCRSKAKCGTTHFFTYATAYAVVRGRRYTLALCRVRAKQTMDYVVRALLARLVTLGIRVKLLLLDRGFYSVRVLRDLITCELPFIMPAGKRGKQPTTPGGPTGTYALAAEKQGQWTSYTLKSAQEGPVDFDLAVVCHNTRGQRGRHQREALLYATWGVKQRPLRWMRATYRGRFGIESSYRQVHQARIRTSSRNPVVRLLFVSVALLLRNVWVWLQAEVIAEPRRGAQHLRPESLRFARLLLWLMMEVANHYRLLRKVPVYRDVYERAQAFGIIFNY
jgi:predicted small integral membrane protein